MLKCLFCGVPIDDESETVTDSNGEIACKACGEAERQTQAAEMEAVLVRRDEQRDRSDLDGA